MSQLSHSPRQGKLKKVEKYFNFVGVPSLCDFLGAG